MVKIRMFINETSSPVRTPSYMPKVTGQLFFFKLRQTRVHLWSILGTVGHHSNGQAGCLFEPSFVVMFYHGDLLASRCDTHVWLIMKKLRIVR